MLGMEQHENNSDVVSVFTSERANLSTRDGVVVCMASNFLLIITFFLASLIRPPKHSKTMDLLEGTLSVFHVPLTLLTHTFWHSTRFGSVATGLVR